MKKVLMVLAGVVVVIALLVAAHCFVMKDESESLWSHLCVHTQLCEGTPSVPEGSEPVLPSHP